MHSNTYCIHESELNDVTEEDILELILSRNAVELLVVSDAGNNITIFTHPSFKEIREKYKLLIE